MGRPVELILEDSLVNAQVAVTKATKLVQKNQVTAILGTSTLEALALLPVANRLRVPVITSNSGSAAITGEQVQLLGVPNEPHSPDGRRGDGLAHQRQPEIQEREVVHDGPRLSMEQTGGALCQDRQGRELRGRGVSLPLDTTDWAPFIAKVRASGATAVVIPVTLGTPLVQFIQQANEFGLTKQATLVAPIGLPDWLIAKLGELSTHIVSAGRVERVASRGHDTHDQKVQRALLQDARRA